MHIFCCFLLFCFFLQADLCGLVAPSPPPLHISLQTPAYFWYHLFILAFELAFI